MRPASIPFRGEPDGRDLSLVLAILAYIIFFVLSGGLTLATTAAQWHNAFDNVLVVEVPPNASVALPHDFAAAIGRDQARNGDQRLAQILDMLTSTPGIRSAVAVPSENLTRELSQWVGSNGGKISVPLPTFVDVTVDSEKILDRRTLAAKLDGLAPGTRLENYGGEPGSFTALLDLFQAIVALVFVLIVAAIALIGTISTRLAITVHAETLDILRRLGAEERDIVGPFADRAFRRGLVGGGVGFALAAATGIALIASGLLPTSLGLTIPPWPVWALLVVIPLLIAGLNMVTARITVVRWLRSTF